jgi:hypothetical protein
MEFKLVIISQDNKKTYTIDLDGIDVNIVFNINDIRNPESLKSNYTKQFSIPATHSNNKAFESLLYNGNYPISFDPNFKLTAQLYGDNTILIDGYLQVNEIVKNDDNHIDEYNVVIYGEISSVFNSLGNLRLSQLDFSEYNHTYNYTNVVNSWDKSIKYNGVDAPFVLGRGYVYPFEWRGQTENIMNTEDFYPAIYAKTIWDKIFKKAGKTYTSNFINSNDFKSLIIPFYKDKIYLDQETQNNAEFRAYQTAFDTVFKNSSNKNVVMYPTVATNTGNLNCVFDTEENDPNNLFDGTIFTTNKKQYTNIGSNVKVRVKYQASVSSGAPWQIVGGPITCNCWLYDITAAKILASEIIEIANPSGTLIGPTAYYSEGSAFLDFSGIIEANHKIKVIVNFTVPSSSYASKFIASTGQAVGGTITPLFQSGSDFYNAIIENWAFEGDTIELNQMIDDSVTVTDFLASMNKMFRLYWVPDGDTNFIIEPRDVLYTKSNVQILDWTEKTNRDTNITITPLAELNNLRYLFTHKEASDYYNEKYNLSYNETYGQKLIEVKNDFVSDTKEVKTIFQPTVLVQMNASERIAPAYVKLEGQFYEALEPGLRINYYGGLISTSDYFLFKSKDNPNGLMKYKYPYAGNFDNPASPTVDINFGQAKQYYYGNNVKTTNNLFNKYWSNSINDIIAPDSHIWAGELHLTPFDIITMNLFDTIQMDQVYYKINKIEFNPNTELANVELVKTTSFAANANTTLTKPKIVNPTPVIPTPTPPTPNPPTPKPWNPWVPWRPPVWEIDGTYNPWYTPTRNPQWEWQGVSEYTDFNETVLNDKGKIAINTSLIERNNRAYTTSKIKPDVHRNFYEATNFIEVSGTDNYVAPEAYAVKVIGNNNRVMAARTVSVVGNNNVVEQGVSNVSIVGDNVIATESNVSYINGAKIKNGSLIEEINYIDGSVNEIQNPINSNGIANYIRSGRNKVQDYGAFSKINYVNGGINTTLLPYQ